MTQLVVSGGNIWLPPTRLTEEQIVVFRVKGVVLSTVALSCLGLFIYFNKAKADLAANLSTDKYFTVHTAPIFSGVYNADFFLALTLLIITIGAIAFALTNFCTATDNVNQSAIIVSALIVLPIIALGIFFMLHVSNDEAFVSWLKKTQGVTFSDEAPFSKSFLTKNSFMVIDESGKSSFMNFELKDNKIYPKQVQDLSIYF